LVTAGLLLRSFRNLATLDLGFDRNQVLVASVTHTVSHLNPADRSDAVYAEIETRLRALPGVAAASRSWNTPVSNMEWNSFVVSDVPHPPQGDDALAYFNFVSDSYFDTLRMRVLAGRNFNQADTASSTAVALINETLARRFFPGLDPVGRTFRVEGEARKLEPPVQVIGVVKDAKYESVREDTFATVFRPVSQMPESRAANYEVRTALPQNAIVEAIRRAIGNVSPKASIEVHTLAAQVDDSMSRERLLAALAAFFGALALVLAMVGLYGTLSYLVTQRRVEFGIRMALGAPAQSILGLVMRDVLLLLLGGIAAGIGLAVFATRVLDSVLFGLRPRDSSTLAMSAVLLAAVSLAAGYLAARRAANLDPASALRHD
jgi:predicted permease